MTRRCSICGINYPMELSFQKCEQCGEPTSVISNAEPHEDWEVRLEFLRQPPTDRDWKVDWHRFNKLQALGVPVDLALQTAGARDLYNGGYAVDLGVYEARFRQLRRRGATVEQAARILAP